MEQCETCLNWAASYDTANKDRSELRMRNALLKKSLDWALRTVAAASEYGAPVEKDFYALAIAALNMPKPGLKRCLCSEQRENEYGICMSCRWPIVY